MISHALSPLDGRYGELAQPLRKYFSEFAFLRSRVNLELDYLNALARYGVCPPLNFSSVPLTAGDAERIQQLEMTTRHDVKAIEYYLREILPSELHPWIHFGLTSEDMNNLSLGIALKESCENIVLPELQGLISSLRDFASKYRDLPMLGKTHGQPAVPTTLGKEIAVYLNRLKNCLHEISNHKFEGKFSGAVGNLNALQFAAPHIDWVAFGKEFVEQFGLRANPVTTQILPYDNWIRYFQSLALINSILIGYAQDIWYYSAAGLLKHKSRAGEVGSSTMPQKINPIHFENAEGNLGIANALLSHFSEKLTASRLQRDLSDSTVRRTFGTALGHCLVAWMNLRQGMDRLEADELAARTELDSHWEVLAEAAQTILRTAGRGDAFESLMSGTQGRTLSKKDFKTWVESADLDDEIRSRLNNLSPETYLGNAIQITNQVLESLDPGSDFRST